MKALNSSLLKKFLQAAGDQLTGHWVLIGGTVLPALNVEIRSTTDIDFVGLPLDSTREQLKLMQIAEDLGLPIESINQASAFFISKISGFENSLVLLHEGRKAKIFRPNLELFIRLKTPRMSETDLSDCLAFLGHAKDFDEVVETEKLRSIVQTEMRKKTEPERKMRLERLLRAIK